MDKSEKTNINEYFLIYLGRFRVNSKMFGNTKFNYSLSKNDWRIKDSKPFSFWIVVNVMIIFSWECSIFLRNRMIGDEMFTKERKMWTRNIMPSTPTPLEDAVKGFRMMNYLIHLFLVFHLFVVFRWDRCFEYAKSL